MISALGALALLAALAAPHHVDPPVSPAPVPPPMSRAPLPPPQVLPPLPGTLPSHETPLPPAGAVQPDVTGPAGYYWATGFNSGNASGHPGEAITAQFYTNSETVPNSADGNHSLTETFTQDVNGHAVEVGMMTDPAFWGTNNPVLFVSTWTGAVFNGYDESAGFVSTSSTIKPGTFQPPLGTWNEYGTSYSGGKVNITYGGTVIGYVPGSFWPNGYSGDHESQTYGEVYNGVAGGDLPTMNGGARDYNAGGPVLGGYGVSSPYELHSETQASFSFTGPA